MADPHAEANGSKPQEESETPLLVKTEQPKEAQEEEEEEEIEVETRLDKTLHRLEYFLALLGFHQSSRLSFGISWAVFLLIGVTVPVVILELSDCPDCEKYQVKNFELDIVVSQACLAAVSLLCLSHNLRKYGIRKFLFVDRYSGQTIRFHDQYVQKIKESIRLLMLWMIPCFILKTTREVIRMMYMPHDSPWHSYAILVAFVLSSTYVTIIFLSACIMFHLVCNLQIIHFYDYGKLLERESDIVVLIDEHVRLRYHLSKISHRFRIYLLLVFLVVTASQFVTLFQTTGYSGIISFVNGGDFAVSSIVQVVGVILCLNAAAKISHRAQGIASLAGRWHASLTCGSSASSRLKTSISDGNLDGNRPLGTFHIRNSESDLESLDFLMPKNTQFASYMSSYHKRQSFVLYLQGNPGGITIYGWTVDRGLISTIFFTQLSLILFVLGKTVVFTSK